MAFLAILTLVVVGFFYSRVIQAELLLTAERKKVKELQKQVQQYRFLIVLSSEGHQHTGTDDGFYTGV